MLILHVFSAVIGHERMQPSSGSSTDGNFEQNEPIPPARGNVGVLSIRSVMFCLTSSSDIGLPWKAHLYEVVSPRLCFLLHAARSSSSISLLSQGLLAPGHRGSCTLDGGSSSISCCCCCSGVLRCPAPCSIFLFPGFKVTHAWRLQRIVVRCIS